MLCPSEEVLELIQYCNKDEGASLLELKELFPDIHKATILHLIDFGFLIVGWDYKLRVSGMGKSKNAHQN